MKTSIMGILNVTPDSFSDGGKYENKSGLLDIDIALRHVERMIEDGAAIIDVGGESTRPGFTIVEAEDEMQRVLPVIEAIKQRFDIKISIDTYKPQVAVAAVRAGADIINDVRINGFDIEMAKAIIDTGAEYILTHNSPSYKNLNTDILETTDLYINAGVDKNKIILDPGIGFNKSYEQNIEALRELNSFCNLGYPVLLGTSNKSVIGNALDLPVGERLEGTIATSVLAVKAGVKYIRVHDVKANYRAVKMAEAILFNQMSE